MTTTARPHVRVLPYDHTRHAGGPAHVVATVFAEYGYELAVDSYESDVAAPHEHFPAIGGGFAVAEDADGRVVGCTGYSDEGNGLFDLRRLYLLRDYRGNGIGRAMVEWVLAEVRARGGRRVELFSDIAFLDAHRLYRRMGFRNHRFRYADDPWRSREWGFVLDLDEEKT